MGLLTGKIDLNTNTSLLYTKVLYLPYSPNLSSSADAPCILPTEPRKCAEGASTASESAKHNICGVKSYKIYKI